LGAAVDRDQGPGIENDVLHAARPAFERFRRP
jgi:hypothetical protein